MKENLKQLFEDEREQWLWDNAKEQREKVPYGDTEVERSVGYSDSDWKRATEHAEEVLFDAVKEVVTEGRTPRFTESLLESLGKICQSN
jgi:hypothetical protein